MASLHHAQPAGRRAAWPKVDPARYTNEMAPIVRSSENARTEATRHTQ